MSEGPPGQGFAAGTLVATPTGTMRVESVQIGNQLLDMAGVARRVAWVGRLAQTPAYLASSPDARAIRITVGALGDGLPQRELLVAPMTELGVSLPNGARVTLAARLLLNEKTILRDGDAQARELFEIELDGGQGVLAEGVQAGSLLANHTATEYRIATVRARDMVFTRAGCMPGPLLGRVDVAERGLIYGWAMDEERPWMRVGLELVVNGRVLTATMASMRRNDLIQASVGDGSCGFHIEPSPPLPTDKTILIQVRRAMDGTDLPGSPVLLDKEGGPAQILEALRPTSPAQAAVARSVLRAGLDKLQSRGD
jgi:hypothetical protein